MKINISITKIRKSKGKSQQEIAELLQTTQQQYSKYETGKQEIPARHIITLSKYYKVPANKILGIETYMTETEKHNKFIELRDKTIDIIQWAVEQGHIRPDGAEILIENIQAEAKEIEEK